MNGSDFIDAAPLAIAAYERFTDRVSNALERSHAALTREQWAEYMALLNAELDAIRNRNYD